MIKPFYLDCNATTPIEPKVLEVLDFYFRLEYGNAGSRTHQSGLVAKKAVEAARAQVAGILHCDSREICFTSGATESNNIAILGLQEFGVEVDKRHIITSSIEHKAILEPFRRLESRGFEVTVLPVGSSGRVDPQALAMSLRPDTLLVSIMHVNNETGVIQPLAEICDTLSEHSAFLHVDAAQGFGKSPLLLTNSRIDMLSISGHKIYGPKGIGALLLRRRANKSPPIVPLMIGGGQERGVRPGTLPVALIAGLGEASELAGLHHETRMAANTQQQGAALAALGQMGCEVNGDINFVLPTTLNLSFPGLNAEAAMVALKGVAEVSNGSACTSSSYEPSHVLDAMGLGEDRVDGALRFSWCHLSGDVDWSAIAGRIQVMI